MKLMKPLIGYKPSPNAPAEGIARLRFLAYESQEHGHGEAICRNKTMKQAMDRELEQTFPKGPLQAYWDTLAPLDVTAFSECTLDGFWYHWIRKVGDGSEIADSHCTLAGMLRNFCIQVQNRTGHDKDMIYGLLQKADLLKLMEAPEVSERRA